MSVWLGDIEFNTDVADSDGVAGAAADSLSAGAGGWRWVRAGVVEVFPVWADTASGDMSSTGTIHKPPSRPGRRA